MGELDIAAFAKNFFDSFGARADLEALRKAQMFDSTGDRISADMWLEITDMVRKLQNLNHISRDGV